jgi:DNA repair ATPase RecN
MKDLVNRLETEAGLTEEQALKAVIIFKDFMNKEGVPIDWEKFFKQKYDHYMEKSKELIKQLSKNLDSFSDKVEDKMEDIAAQTKKAARDLSKKVYDKLNED